MAKQVKRTRRTPEQMAEARANESKKKIAKEEAKEKALITLGINESKGLGDTIEKVFEATGIKKLVHFIAGDDCNCDKRKEALNKWFPYHKTLCLDEKEYNYLDAFFTSKRNDLTHSEQVQMLVIYNRVFTAKQQSSNCASCWRDTMNDLKKVYETYEAII